MPKGYCFVLVHHSAMVSAQKRCNSGSGQSCGCPPSTADETVDSDRGRVRTTSGGGRA
jgi:hypothetical protein